MTGELVPNPNILMGDSDRERVIERLHAAVGEGRLTLPEFEDRMSGVLAARTFADVTPYIADLPGPVGAAPSDGQLAARGSRITRIGPWIVPARMTITAVGSTVLLDFVDARLTSQVVHIAADLRGSTLRMILPAGSTVDAGAAALNGASVRVRGGLGTYAGPGLHLVITGNLHGSTIWARPPRPRRWWRRHH